MGHRKHFTFVIAALALLAASGRASAQSGWTTFQPSPDTRIVYVSSSLGNDGNSGLSPASPKRSIAAGKALMRDGYPDWLLLRRGDSWNEPIGQWISSGRSAAEPTLISAYGNIRRRPLLLTGNSSGIWAGPFGPSPASLHDVAIVDLHFYADANNGTSGSPAGVSWMIPSHGLLVEGCYIEAYETNFSIPGSYGEKYDIRLRRNVIADAFSVSNPIGGSGIYAANAHDLLIEENVIDHNGWNENVPGAVPTDMRHGIYIQAGAPGAGACTNVTVRGNIFTNNRSEALQMRSGGLVQDNLFVHNAIGILLGGGNDPTPGGVATVCKGNVILDGVDLDPSNHRGWGIELANVNSAEVSYNIVANIGTGHFPLPLELYGSTSGMGVHNAVVSHNIFWRWGGSILLQGNSTQLSNIALSGNDISNTLDSNPLMAYSDSSGASSSAGLSSFNRFFANAPANAWMMSGSAGLSLAAWKNMVGDTTSTVLDPASYPDPNRTIATYNQSLGGDASLAAFTAQARRQWRGRWRPEYTAAAAIAYFRAGFNLVVP